MEAHLPSRLRASLSLSLPSLSFTTIVLLLAFVLSPAVAQNVQLLPTAASSTFPACALQCTTLQQAATGCVPPAAPVTDQAIYVSCFCQSALLTTLHTTADSVCNTQCTSESDRQLLMTWYKNYCNSGGKDVGGPTTTTTAAAAPAKSGTSTAAANLYPAPPSWISTHYRWVIMIVVLVVGFSALAVLGIWFKRRYDEKHQGLYHGEDSGIGQPGKGRFFGSSNPNPSNNDSPGASSAAIAHNREMWGANNPAITAHTREIAPVDDPGFVASSSRTEVSSTHTLVGGGPPPGSPRVGTGRSGGSKLAQGSPLSE